MRKFLMFLVLGTFALLPAAQADTVYTSSGAFFAAIAGLSPTVEDYSSGFFDGQGIPNGFAAHGITYDQFNLTSGATQGIITNQYNSFSGLSLGADHTDLGSAFTYFLGGEGATISFATPITAFGMWFNVNLDSGQYGFLYGASGEAFTDSATYDTESFVFVGVVADSPFSSLTFSSTDVDNGVYNVPEMIYASGGSVPEPSSILLLGTSALGAFGVIRRRLGR
jgi:hypothetical protein